MKHYYIDLGAVPFAKVHILEKKLEELPKHWREMTEKEYTEYLKKW